MTSSSSLCTIQHCFICGSEIVSLEINSHGRKLCERFCVLVGRYLNINRENKSKSSNFKFDFEKTLNSNQSSEVGSKKIHCCESCFVEVEVSCELFEQFSLVQLELNNRIKSIEQLMKNRSQPKINEASRRKIDQNEDEKFRNEIISRVDEGCKTFPCLRLTKLKTVTMTTTQSNFRATKTKSNHRHTNLPLIPEVVQVHIDSPEKIDSDSDPAPNLDLTKLLPTPTTPEKATAKLTDVQKSVQILGTTSNIEMLSSAFLKCRYCDNCYISEESRMEHEQTHENQQQLAATTTTITPEPPQRKLQFQCRFCDAKFFRSDVLQGHERGHTGERPFSCSICHKKFTLRLACNTHNQKVHNGSAEVVKDSSFVEYNAQMRPSACNVVHGKIKPFCCRVCGRGFTKRLSLLNHEATHGHGGNEESSADLNVDKDKPYICEICGKRFSSWLYKERHKKIIHTDSRPFKCPHCEMRFKQNQPLLSHKRTHFGIQPFECGLCTTRFTTSSSCKVHQRNVHKVTNGNIIRHSLNNDTQNIETPGSVSNGMLFNAVPTYNENQDVDNDDEAIEVKATHNDNCILPDMEMSSDSMFTVGQDTPEINVSKCEILGWEDEDVETLESDLFDPLADV